MVKGVKQTKLGFDKNFAEKQDVDRPLVGIRGNLLRDQNGDFLYTVEQEAPPGYFAPEKSTPILLNNEGTPQLERYKGSLPVEEQFPVLSEVSTSLLGIPRLGKQQSLLADVSVYGLDENTWEYQYFAAGFQPPEWGQRENPTYGKRFRPRLVEYEKESALALEMFPVPFGFPYGPNFEDQGRYTPSTFTLYLRFVELGNILYDYYKDKNLKFAEDNFLPKEMVEVVGEILVNNARLADVDYKDSNRETFLQIEKWTLAWMDIRDNKFVDITTGALLDIELVNNILALNSRDYEFSNTQPGYSGNTEWYAQLTSKEAFRYQPGAISGYTYGLRLNSDPASEGTTIEWGAVNNTDHYVFQVRGSKFSIVRRSTVPLSEASLAKMGKVLDDQAIEESPNPLERPGNPDDITGDSDEFFNLYTVSWTQDEFNGDGLNGAGASGYTLSFNEVTMYKIEFSWYGAIGAKFYAYIPIGNGEARWVLLHTILIENMLEFPSLKNPFMKFRYSINCGDQTSLRNPVYVYKYGASYYIDGDDEGTYTFNNYAGQDQKPITSFYSTPVMGFFAKDQIKNLDGIGTDSQKNFYFDRMNITASENTKVDILQCEGCQRGFGHFYAPSLKNGIRAQEERFRINAAGSLEYVEEGKFFTPADNGKHVLGDGVYCSYIYIPPEDLLLNSLDSVRLLRRNGSYTDSTNTPLLEGTGYEAGDIVQTQQGVQGILNYTFTGRITGYDDIVASIQPTTKDNFTIHYLNNNETHSIGGRDLTHYKSFRLGCTRKVPQVTNVNGEDVLLFDGEPLDFDNELWADWVPFEPGKSIEGYESNETDPRYGGIMRQDARLGKPAGEDTGFCSELNFTMKTVPAVDVEYVTELITDSGTITGNLIVFREDPELSDVTGGEVGIWDGVRYIGSGIYFTSPIFLVTSADGSDVWYAEIDSPIDLSTSVKEGVTVIAFKILDMFGRFVRKFKAFGFGDKQFYIWVAMEDEAEVMNICVEEFDQTTTNSFIPNWIKSDDCNITVSNVSIEQDFFDGQGRLQMGGASSTNLAGAQFVDYNRLDSVKVDANLSQPLRPSFVKTSFFVGAGQTEIIDMDYLFGIDRFKLTSGTFNNQSVYLSATTTDPESSGTISVNVNGKEQ